MESTDILIIILMFAMPVVSAILDRKKKARKAAGQPARREVRRPAPFEPFASENMDFPEEEVEQEAESPAQQEMDPEVRVPEPPEEGESVVFKSRKAHVREAEQASVEKEKIDVAKLIVYDAIMNPKFKE